MMWFHKLVCVQTFPEVWPQSQEICDVQSGFSVDFLTMGVSQAHCFPVSSLSANISKSADEYLYMSVVSIDLSTLCKTAHKHFPQNAELLFW